MALDDLLSKLAIVSGFKQEYVNYKGENERVPVSKLAKVFRGMGVDVSSPEAIHHAIFEFDAKQWLTLLKPCYVLSPLVPWGIEFHLPEMQNDPTVAWHIQYEDGEEQLGECALPECEWLGDYWIEGVKHNLFRLPLPDDLPLGYHVIHVEAGPNTSDAKLIVAPGEAYQPPAIKLGEKLWGASIQLYTLKSERNWGMGDFTDLAALIKGLAKQGADYVGLNPIHSMFNANPHHASPYSPSNRQFNNWLYLDIEAVEEFALADAVVKQVQSAAFQKKLQQARATDRVDYGLVSELKLPILEKLFKVFLKNKKLKPARYKKYQKYVALKGESLMQQATYDALYEHFYQAQQAYGWQAWPEAYQNHHSAEVQTFTQENAERVLFWAWLQFLCDEQLEKVYKQVKRQKLNIGLYRDLAVGSDRGGAETWVNAEVFQNSLSVGAPPDLLAQQGQNWGLPPIDPLKLQQEGFDTFIRLVRANMENCGALRIDHAMSVFRLWWCPDGEPASEGVYRLYPFYDMLGILNLESHRNNCMIIAEDLGTVPTEVAENFPRVGYFSNKVFLFEMVDGECRKPSAYQQKALAMVCNHDMPTLAAWWQGSDLELRDELGLFLKPEFKEMEINNRNYDKQAVLRALEKQGLYGDEIPALLDHQLLDAMQQYVGLCESQLMTIQLEDLQLIETPVNIPGTSSEYPNWQRKQQQTLEELFKNKALQKSMKAITAARAK